MDHFFSQISVRRYLIPFVFITFICINLFLQRSVRKAQEINNSSFFSKPFIPYSKTSSLGKELGKHDVDELKTSNEEINNSDTSSSPLPPPPPPPSLPSPILDALKFLHFSPNEKFMWYGAHSGFGNQVIELRWAMRIASLLNRTLILPPITPQFYPYANGPGNCATDPIRPARTRFGAWGIYSSLLSKSGYISIADVLDFETIPTQVLKTIDFRLFVILFCGCDVRKSCGGPWCHVIHDITSQLNKSESTEECLERCGYKMGGLKYKKYNKKIKIKNKYNQSFTLMNDNITHHFDLTCHDVTWTLGNYSSLNELIHKIGRTFDLPIAIYRKVMLNQTTFPVPKNLVRELGSESSAASAQVLALGSTFQPRVVDMHLFLENEFVYDIYTSSQWLKFTRHITNFALGFIQDYLPRNQFACMHFRAGDGFFSHPKAKKKLSILFDKGLKEIYFNNTGQTYQEYSNSSSNSKSNSKSNSNPSLEWSEIVSMSESATESNINNSKLKSKSKSKMKLFVMTDMRRSYWSNSILGNLSNFGFEAVTLSRTNDTGSNQTENDSSRTGNGSSQTTNVDSDQAFSMESGLVQAGLIQEQTIHDEFGFLTNRIPFDVFETANMVMSELEEKWMQERGRESMDDVDNIKRNERNEKVERGERGDNNVKNERSEANETKENISKKRMNERNARMQKDGRGDIESKHAHMHHHTRSHDTPPPPLHGDEDEKGDVESEKKQKKLQKSFVLFIEQAICSCGSLGFQGSPRSTSTGIILTMRNHSYCSQNMI